jgi:hypothetical protein
MIWLRYAYAVVAILITGRIDDERPDEHDQPDAQRQRNKLLPEIPGRANLSARPES